MESLIYSLNQVFKFKLEDSIDCKPCYESLAGKEAILQAASLHS